MDKVTDFYCFRIGALSRRISRYYNNRYAYLGITIGQSFVLAQLLEKDGRSVKDIALALQLDSPAVTGLVDRLVKQDLVVRKEDPRDRRSIQIFLTPEGRRTAEEAVSIASEFNPHLRRYLAEGSLAGLEQTMAELERELQDQKGKDEAD